MVKDIKYLYQLEAEELARKTTGREFDELEDQTQTDLYNQAMVNVEERLIAQAEGRDQLKPPGPFITRNFPLG